MKVKELTPKEAMLHMLNGGECDAHLLHIDVVEKFRYDEVRGVVDEKNSQQNLNDVGRVKYYIHETPPKLMEGVGSCAINKEANDFQSVIYHCDTGYYVPCHDLPSKYYKTLSALKKEWHIIG